MQRAACKDWAEVSCLLANLVAELEQPCRKCGEADRLVLTGRSPTGEVSREKIMESFTAWEAHAKHGDTKQLRREMRSRLLAALDRAEQARRAAGIPAAQPGPNERRTKRYGTVTFQSGGGQPRQAEREHQAHQIHQAGQ